MSKTIDAMKQAVLLLVNCQITDAINVLGETIDREEAQPVEPVAYTTPFDWKSRETERIVKVARKPQPEYDYTMPVHLAPATDRGALIITLRNFTYDPPIANALMRVAAGMLAADAQWQSRYEQREEEAHQLSEQIIKLREQQVAAPQGEVANLWCETCEGTSKVYEEAQIGIVGSGGTIDCPDCEGKGYIESSVYRTLPQATTKKSGDAHEIWAAAQLVPGEGIEDGVARVEALLNAPRVPMTRDQVDDLAEDSVFLQTIYGIVRSIEAHHSIGVKP